MFFTFIYLYHAFIWIYYGFIIDLSWIYYAFTTFVPCPFPEINIHENSHITPLAKINLGEITKKLIRRNKSSQMLILLMYLYRQNQNMYDL